MKYNFLSLVTISCILFSSIICLAIILKNRRSRRLYLWLVLFIISTNISIFNIGFFIYTGNYKLFPHLLSMSSITTFSVGPFFYFYIRGIFVSENRKFRYVCHLLPVIIVFGINFIYLAKSSEEKIQLINNLISGNLSLKGALFCGGLGLIGIMHMAVYFFLSYLRMKKSRKTPPRHSGKSAKFLNWIVFAVHYNLGIIVGFMIIGIISIFFKNNLNVFYQAIPVVIGVSLCIIGLRILFFPEFFLLDNPAFLQGYKTNAKEPDEYNDSKYPKLLLSRISSCKLYQDPELTLNDLAREVDVSRSALSRIINSEFRVNFYDFINKFRIDEVKKCIEKDPVRTNILDTAYQSGFKSKTTFNVCFKRYENMTPSQYKKKILEKK